VQDTDPRHGKMRFDAKEHADACLAKRDADGVCKFELEDEAGTLTVKLNVLSGDAEKEAWRKYRLAASQRDEREGNKKRFSGGGRGQGSAKRGRS
jgi:RNA binding motif